VPLTSTGWLYNRDEKYLLRGTNSVFKLSSLRFIFKGLILCKEIIAGFLRSTKSHRSTLCGRNVEFLNVKLGGM
jgi:hypothetical protein